MDNAKDFLGNPLKVGDKVVFCELNYRNLTRGTIRSITPKMVFIHWQGHKAVRQLHGQVIKV